MNERQMNDMGGGSVSPGAGGYTITVARSKEDVFNLNFTWETMGLLPIDYYLNLYKDAQDTVIRPHVIVVKKNNSPRIVLVGRVEKSSFELKIGNLGLLEVPIRKLAVMTGGIQGVCSENVCEILMSELIRSAKEDRLDMIFVDDIRPDSNIYRMGTKLSGYLLRDYFPKKDVHYRMPLPASMEDFYRARKKKRNLHRIVRRLERSFPEDLEVKVLKDVADVERICGDAYLISRKTYQFARGGGFDNDQGTFSLIKSLVEKGTLRAYFLYIEEKPCCFFIGNMKGSCMELIFTGFDPAYRKYEIGTYLLLKMVEDSIDVGIIKSIDFGFSATVQKRRFCDDQWDVVHFQMFRPSLKGVLLNAIKVFNGSVDKAGRSILKVARLDEVYDAYKHKLTTRVSDS